MKEIDSGKSRRDFPFLKRPVREQLGIFPYAQEDKDSMEELLAELKQMKGDLEVSQKCLCTYS